MFRLVCKHVRYIWQKSTDVSTALRRFIWLVYKLNKPRSCSLFHFLARRPIDRMYPPHTVTQAVEKRDYIIAVYLQCASAVNVKSFPWKLQCSPNVSHRGLGSMVIYDSTRLVKIRLFAFVFFGLSLPLMFANYRVKWMRTVSGPYSIHGSSLVTEPSVGALCTQL